MLLYSHLHVSLPHFVMKSFFYKKKYLYVTVRIEWFVANTSQIAALGYVSHTNQTATEGYVSPTNQIKA